MGTVGRSPLSGASIDDKCVTLSLFSACIDDKCVTLFSPQHGPHNLANIPRTPFSFLEL